MKYQMKSKSLKQFITIALTTLSVLYSPISSANILLFQSSDNHSDYGNLPGYIWSTSALAQNFWDQNPGHPIIHLSNGDLAGPSTPILLEGGEDRGFLNYRVFGLLNHRYQSILNIGNHEAFDYTGEEGIRLFIEQAHGFMTLANMPRLPSLQLRYNSGHPVRFTTANVVTTDEARNLFEPFHEITSPTGKRIRFVGILLEDFYAWSTYNSRNDSKVLLFKNIQPMLESAKEQTLRAASDGADSVIFFFHEQYKIVSKVISDLKKWKKEAEVQNPALARIQIPVVFAGHDHTVHSEQIEDTTLIDSGDSYAFSEVELDNDGRLVRKQHWSVNNQQVAVHSVDLYPEERAALEETEAFLTAARANGDLPVRREDGSVYTSPGVNYTRLELKKARMPLGTALANVLREWAQDELRKKNLLTEVKDVLTFFNSGSYRGTKPIAAGPISRAMAIAPYPLPSDSKIFLLTGSQIQKMYSALRGWGVPKNEYTPQLPATMREVEGSTSFDLEILSPEGWFVAIDPTANYALATDTWLSINGFKIEAFGEPIADARTVSAEISIQNQILLKYFPKHLEQLGCVTALSVEGSKI